MPRTAAPRTPATPTTKKATGQKTASGRTPRTPRKTTSTANGTAKAPTKTTTRKTAATSAGKATKKATTSAARTKTTQPAVKKATAWPEFITHKMINAHYQARLHRLPTRNIRDWRELADGTAALHFPSGARLDHTPTEDAPFHANTPCPHGHMHRQPVRTPADLADAEKAAKDCTAHAGSAQAANIAITRVLPATTPAADDDAEEPAPDTDGRHHTPTWARPDIPGEAPTVSIPVDEEPVTQAIASAADTQQLSEAEIAAGLAARAANDTDTAKEHPQP